MKRHLYYFDACYTISPSFLSLCSGNHSSAACELICFLSSDECVVLLKLYSLISLLFCAHCFPFPSSLLPATTLPTPVSEITTLSSQSNTSSSAHPAASSSLSPEIELATRASELRTDESLAVVPLTANKTIPSSDSMLLTVTSSTQSPTTVNMPETKIRPESSERTPEQFVSNDGNNQSNRPQPELLAGDETDERSRSNQEKEGRAFSFPSSEVSSYNQSSTLSGPMQGSVNYVTTSTEKTHIMSFFDLSDVSMDHEENEQQMKVIATTTTTTTEKQDLNNERCNHNGSTFKASLLFTRKIIDSIKGFLRFPINEDPNLNYSPIYRRNIMKSCG